MGKTRLSFMVSDELKAAIDLARRDVPRERWLRRVVERDLDRMAAQGDPEFVGAVERPLGEVAPAAGDEKRALAPSSAGKSAPDRRQHVPGPSVENVRSSVQAKDFRPYPKGGKRS